MLFKSLKLLFKKENGTPMEVYLKSLNESSFFMIPSIVDVGEYKLNEITLITDYGLKIYSIDSLDSNNKLNDVIVLNVVEGSNSSSFYTSLVVSFT